MDIPPVCIFIENSGFLEGYCTTGIVVVLVWYRYFQVGGQVFVALRWRFVRKRRFFLCGKCGYVTFGYRLVRVDRPKLTKMGKSRVVFVGFSSKSGFHVASTKAGLGRLLGVSSRTVMRNLDGGKNGMVSLEGEVWWIAECEVSKVARAGKVGSPVTSKIGR